MTTKDIVAEVAARCELSKKDVSLLVDALTNSISNALVEGKVVHIQDFGDWEAKTRPSRNAVHPKTGERITTQEHKSIVFKQTAMLKKVINEE